MFLVVTTYCRSLREIALLDGVLRIYDRSWLDMNIIALKYLLTYVREKSIIWHRATGWILSACYCVRTSFAIAGYLSNQYRKERERERKKKMYSRIWTCTSACSNPYVAVFEIRADGGTLYIVGVAHISSQSAKDVVEVIERIEPFAVLIELDAERFGSLTKNYDLARFGAQAAQKIDSVEKVEKHIFAGKLDAIRAILQPAVNCWGAWHALEFQSSRRTLPFQFVSGRYNDRQWKSAVLLR